MCKRGKNLLLMMKQFFELNERQDFLLYLIGQIRKIIKELLLSVSEHR
jgi:hypothetical protein